MAKRHIGPYRLRGGQKCGGLSVSAVPEAGLTHARLRLPPRLGVTGRGSVGRAEGVLRERERRSKAPRKGPSW